MRHLNTGSYPVLALCLHRGLRAGAVATLIGMTAPLIAQPLPAQPLPADTSGADADADAGLTDIVVTASRREESLQRTPISVSAIAGDAIEQQKISNFRDLSGRVPGLLAPKRSTAYTTQTYSIRGIGEIDTYPEPSVAVYVDDVYLARTVGSLYDTPDLERVEVLRGPQGTLYGRNSSAGAIRFITKDPKADRELFVSTTYGSYHNVDLKARISGAILPNDALNGSFSIIRHTRDGWQYSIPLNRHVNDLDITVLRAKLKSQITDRLSATLSGDVMFDRSSQSYYTPVNQPNGQPNSGQPTNPDLSWEAVAPYNFTDAYGGSLTLRYEIDPHLVAKSVTAYRGINGPINYGNSGVTAIKSPSLAGFKQYQVTQEYNLNGEYDHFNFVLGAYYFYENFHNHRLSQSASGKVDNVGTVTHTNNWLKTESYSVYGQVNWLATDRLTLTVGGRWTTDQRKFHNIGQQGTQWGLHDASEWGYDQDRFFVQYPTGTESTSTFKSFDATSDPRRFSQFTPKLGVQVQWTPNLFQYASYSKGFKSGGYDLRTNTEIGTRTPYLPQILTTYEAGLKSTLFDNRLTANIAIFYNDIKDFQVRATSGASQNLVINQLINAGKAASWGGELELSAAPFEGLRLNGSAAYLRTKYRTFTADLPNNVPGRKTLIGLDFPLSPRWQLSGSFSYALPLKIPGTVRIGADVQYESKRFADIYNTEQIAVQGQTFANGTINYTTQDKSVTVGVQVSNIFDLRRGQSGSYAPTNAGSTPLYYLGYNEPRMANVFVSKTF
ncbi:MAG TPA: TonB-dependent receptor [Sphingobium sp.]